MTSASTVRRIVRRGASLVAVAIFLHAMPAGAQSSNDAAARALFAEGRKLSLEGKWQEACPKFEESLRLVPGAGTRFNLADCWEHTGRTASAWSAFLDVAAESKAAGQTDREKAARERADALAAKVPKLVVQVATPEPGLAVKRNGVEVGQGSWGIPLPVDPGSVRVEASAPSKKTFVEDVTATDGATATVQIPALEADLGDDGSRPAPMAPSAPASAGVDTGSGGFGTQKTIAVVVGGVGVVGVVVGTVFFFGYKSSNDDAKAVCPEGRDCEPGSAARHAELLDDARSARTLTYVGLGIGAAALGGAAALYFTAPPSEGATAVSWSLRPSIAKGAVGAAVNGSF